MPTTDPAKIAAKREREAAKRRAMRHAQGVTPRASKNDVCEACHLSSLLGRPAEGVLHSCENFPMPAWTQDYLRAFDALVQGHGPNGEVMTARDVKWCKDYCSDLAALKIHPFEALSHMGLLA